MDEIPTEIPRFNAKNPLHVFPPQRTQLTHAPHLAHRILDVFGRHPRYAPQELFRSCIHTRTYVWVLFGPDRNRSRRVRLGIVRFEVVEYVCRCVRRGRPDDAQTRKVEREQDELRLDRGRRSVRLGRRAGLLGRVLG